MSPAILGYALAVFAVGMGVIGLAQMQTRWQAAANVSILLMAVIATTRVAGAKAGAAATVLAILAFFYLLEFLPDPQADPTANVIRLLGLAIVSWYVVWITATERGRVDSLSRALAVAQTTHEELRTSEAKFRALAESAPAAIFICEDGTIRYCNPAAAVITGFRCEELCGKDFVEHLAPDSREVARARRAARTRGDAVAARFETKIVTKSGEERDLDFTEAPFEFGGRPAIIGLAWDITERKRAEVAVRNSQQLLDQVLATLPVGVFVTNREGDFTLNNAIVRGIWGERPPQRGAERWAQIKAWWHDSGKRIAPEEWASVRALSLGQTSLNELIDIETFTGERKTVQNSAAPVRNTEGQIVGAVIVNEDVTERVRAEEALRESADRLQHLSRRLLAVQEEERRHLSRELHDEFGQLLFSINLHLEAAKGAAGPAAQPSLDESITLLHRAGAQVRSLALELRPMLLETAGLDATLRWLAEKHQQRTGIVTEVVGKVPEVTGEVAIACFRIAQEALTNVARHAAARHVWIELSQSEGLLRLVIRDDGVGFDVSRTLEDAAAGGHLGLVGMRERVDILGGRLTIESTPESGTRIEVSFPLGEAAAGQEPQTPA